MPIREDQRLDLAAEMDPGEPTLRTEPARLTLKVQVACSCETAGFCCTLQSLPHRCRQVDRTTHCTEASGLSVVYQVQVVLKSVDVGDDRVVSSAGARRSPRPTSSIISKSKYYDSTLTVRTWSLSGTNIQ